MTRKEVSDNFVLNLERERTSLGLTQAEMAQKLELSTSGYKKMIAGQTAKVDLYIAYRMHLLTGKWFSEFCGEVSEETKIISLLHRLNKPQLRFIKGIVDLELAFQDSGNITETEDYVSLLTLTGNQEDGMVWDSFHMEKLNVSCYRRRFGDDLHCALRINSNHFHPVYQSGDILLISQTALRDGDTGIFVNRETSRTYLRRFRQTNSYILESLNDFGISIVIDNNNKEEMAKWIRFGRVLSKMRR